MTEAIEWIRTAFEQAGYQPVAIPLAFALGLASALAAACCALPLVGAIVGYSGLQDQANRKERLLGAAFFMLGNVLAILVLGLTAGFISQAAQAALGKYWKVFGGVLAIGLGLAALNLLPFRNREKKAVEGQARRGMLGAALAGLIMGGAISVCSLACNPGIFIILGVAVLQGFTMWMVAILISYAIGFSLPLVAVLLGVSFGKAAINAKKAEQIIRVSAGAILIGVGFYFLASF